jgi:hypothetical protein
MLKLLWRNILNGLLFVPIYMLLLWLWGDPMTPLLAVVFFGIFVTVGFLYDLTIGVWFRAWLQKKYPPVKEVEDD